MNRIKNILKARTIVRQKNNELNSGFWNVERSCVGMSFLVQKRIFIVTMIYKGWLIRRLVFFRNLKSWILKTYLTRMRTQFHIQNFISMTILVWQTILNTSKTDGFCRFFVVFLNIYFVILPIIFIFGNLKIGDLASFLKGDRLVKYLDKPKKNL